MTEEVGDREQFVNELQWALAHLYDPAELRKSSLVARFGLQRHSDPLGALRSLLSGAIQGLKPADSVPLHADIWRVYHVLTYRYSEQLSQREVAADLGLSIRHLRRLEREAVTVLADRLRAQYALQSPERASGAGGAASADMRAAVRAAPNRAPLATPGPDREGELAWLAESLPHEVLDLTLVIAGALRTVLPLSEGSGVALEQSLPPGLPPVLAPRGIVRQALLNLLTAAVHCAPAGRVEVSAEVAANEVHVTVSSRSPVGARPGGEVSEKLDMTRRLVEPSGGRLWFRADETVGSPFAATLALPLAEQITVLAIDDHADALRLLERYAAGTRYRITGTREPEQAMHLAEELAVRAIVLDIMLPGVDGWELLGRLREHPRLREVPVIVCTILPQEQLALALGAAAFLRKPLSREAFLSALDQQVGQPWRESR
jgi:CheY-like chemotaxis protein/transcriptional regulator with XRE-family HTH domain